MSSSISATPSAHLVPNSTERRKADRLSSNVSAILRYQDRLATVQGIICDIGIGGCGFICQQAVIAHSKCTLQFELPALQHLPAQAVKVSVVVINSMQVVGQAYQFRVNLQFTGLPPKARSHIEAIIRHSLAR